MAEHGRSLATPPRERWTRESFQISNGRPGLGKWRPRASLGFVGLGDNDSTPPSQLKGSCTQANSRWAHPIKRCENGQTGPSGHFRPSCMQLQITVLSKHFSESSSLLGNLELESLRRQL